MSARINYTGAALSLLVGVLAFAGLVGGDRGTGGGETPGTVSVQIADGPSGSLIWD
ncbi:hypothetical protein Axi01nite_17570 [Actinoplanes xinjiangensis]|jgi:hypothetical protein|nr:hypothetical protein Axi01nite_17570 [Actinoplanes xinjiangensis]